MAPETILAALADLDPGVRLERYYGERSAFYNPGRRAPLGVIFASLKQQDGPNDRASLLSRPGVYRLAFQLTPTAFRERFGEPPARPPRGQSLTLEHDPTTLNILNILTPHPVYAWMRWVQVLSPSPGHFAELTPSIEESLALARAKRQRRRGS